MTYPATTIETCSSAERTPQPCPRILGLAPRHRHLGYSLLGADELQDFGVRRFIGLTDDARRANLYRHLRDLLHRSRATQIVVEVSDGERDAFLSHASALIRGMADAAHIPVTELQSSTVRTFFGLDQCRLWRRGQGQKIASRYPCLRRHVSPAPADPQPGSSVYVSNTEKYWWPGFAAAGAALTHLYANDSTPSSSQSS